MTGLITCPLQVANWAQRRQGTGPKPQSASAAGTEMRQSDQWPLLLCPRPRSQPVRAAAGSHVPGDGQQGHRGPCPPLFPICCAPENLAVQGNIGSLLLPWAGVFSSCCVLVNLGSAESGSCRFPGTQWGRLRKEGPRGRNWTLPYCRLQGNRSGEGRHPFTIPSHEARQRVPPNPFRVYRTHNLPHDSCAVDSIISSELIHHFRRLHLLG